MKPKVQRKIVMLSRKEVANVMGVTTRTIYNWVERGKFPPPAMIFGRPRWKATDIEEYVSGQFSRARSM